MFNIDHRIFLQTVPQQQCHAGADALVIYLGYAHCLSPLGCHDFCWGKERHVSNEP